MEVISLMNMKGGVGKTTLAVNISHILNKEFGHRVLTIDIDPQFNASQIVFKQTDWVKILSEHIHTSLRIFIDKEFESVKVKDEYIEPLEFHEIKPTVITKNWHFIPGSVNLYKIELNYFKILKFRLKEYIDYQRKRGRYDYLIIDTPPTPSSWMRSAIIASDYYLVPVKPDPLSVWGFTLLVRIIRELKEQENESEIRCLGGVFNMYENRKDHKAQMMQLRKSKYLRVPFFENSLKKRADIARMEHENTFLEDRLIHGCGNRDAKKEIINITKEFKQKLNYDRSQRG